jgi:NitT/TauT family transport system permease protein
MTFSFYQSLRTLPKELEEAAALYQLSGWQRFTKLELPTAMIGLLWNAMMSFGGGWFFVAASEAISVLNQEFTLPGIGSYVAAAIAAEDLAALGWAVVTMAMVIMLVDQLFWRPLIVWSDKFRLEQSASADSPESWLYDLLQTARIPRLVGRALAPVREWLNRYRRGVGAAKPQALWHSPSGIGGNQAGFSITGLCGRGIYPGPGQITGGDGNLLCQGSCLSRTQVPVR